LRFERRTLHKAVNERGRTLLGEAVAQELVERERESSVTCKTASKSRERERERERGSVARTWRIQHTTWIARAVVCGWAAVWAKWVAVYARPYRIGRYINCTA
jgi:hypothetical protein